MSVGFFPSTFLVPQFCQFNDLLDSTYLFSVLEKHKVSILSYM